LEIIKTNIEGLLVLKPKVFGDDRGYFFESYSQERFSKAGVSSEFIQDNISKSKKGTVRGLHYQIGKSTQGKLCQIIFGKVLDVAVDIRFGSPTYGKHFTFELSDENHAQLWIPPGFAHGFSVLSDVAIFSYKCTELYSKENERSIIYNDIDLNINWQVENPVVSEKDLMALPFKNIEKDFIY
jgi:dTDP-4-dehydrorhamnose 3,5-epimerase